MKKIYTFLVLILSANLGFSQGGQQTDYADYTKLIDIMPPSPYASSLGTYGGASSDLITGAVNVSVPIYSLAIGKHAIPVGISYSSSGFRVDDIQTQVGTGWTLNAGGVISRVIYGVPDEFAQRIVPPTNISDNRREFNWFLQQASPSSDYKTTDAEPDLFSLLDVYLKLKPV